MINEITLGYCLEVMPRIPDNSVDLILTDPPYFKVKGEAWDNQWDDSADFLAFIGTCADEWRRILKPNGSLYCFASTKMAALVEIEISKRFAILNRITWKKRSSDQGNHGQWSRANKETLRCYFTQKEEIIFAEHFGADNIAKGEAGYAAKCNELRGFVFEPLRAYLDDERKRAGIGKDECNEACGFSRCPGGMAARHYFSRSQWCLPTAEHYAALQKLFNRTGGDFLRREYEELRRPFFATPYMQFTDIWDFKTVPAGPDKHPCEKPQALLQQIIKASSRPGSVVLDCFSGTGSTCIAAEHLGRSYIGIEKEPEYVEIARRRIDRARRQTKLF